MCIQDFITPLIFKKLKILAFGNHVGMATYKRLTFQ